MSVPETEAMMMTPEQAEAKARADVMRIAGLLAAVLAELERDEGDEGVVLRYLAPELAYAERVVAGMRCDRRDGRTCEQAWLPDEGGTYESEWCDRCRALAALREKMAVDSPHDVQTG